MPMPPTPTPPLKGRGLNGTERSVTMLTEINFDGIIGPSHNYAGLSRGNIASACPAGDASQPRAAALHGIAKMLPNPAFGLEPVSFLPLDTPGSPVPATCGATRDHAVGPTRAPASSATSMCGRLLPGKCASASRAGDVARPGAAALQGIENMRHNLALGLAKGFFMPLDRPDAPWLATLGATLEDAEGHLRAQAWSASSMWAANAATVSPAPDSADGKCHLTVANLVTMPHRSHEWPGTLAQLRLAFANPAFQVHAPVPAPFGDEGAANHMRLCSGHDGEGVEIFVYGVGGGRFPARQHLDASKAIARKHRLDPARTLFIRQSDSAIPGGAFPNDVVAVSNAHCLFPHKTHSREH